MFYSKSTGGFYDPAINVSIPADAVQITDDAYQALFAAQSTGKVITADASGNPIAVDPVTLLTLTQAKERKVSELSAACKAQIAGGFTSSALGAAYTYPSTMTDQQNLSTSVLASLMPGLSSTWTTPYWCSDAAGVWYFRAHTAAQIQQVGQDGKLDVLSAMAKNKQLAEQVNAATTIDAVNAISW